MHSIRDRQATYGAAMDRYVSAFQALGKSAPVDPIYCDEFVVAQRDLLAAAEELIDMDVRTADDVLDAIDALRFAVQTMGIFPQPADHIANKIASAVSVLALEALVRLQQDVAGGSR